MANAQEIAILLIQAEERMLQLENQQWLAHRMKVAVDRTVEEHRAQLTTLRRIAKEMEALRDGNRTLGA